MLWVLIIEMYICVIFVESSVMFTVVCFSIALYKYWSDNILTFTHSTGGTLQNVCIFKDAISFDKISGYRTVGTTSQYYNKRYKSSAGTFTEIQPDLKCTCGTQKKIKNNNLFHLHNSIKVD